MRSDSVPEMENAVRTLQQQVNALMAQNATPEAQLRGQQNMALGLAELPGAITTVLNRAQAPTRRMFVDQKGLGMPPVFSDRERRLLRVGQEGQELRVRCVPERAWSLDVCLRVAGRGHSDISCARSRAVYRDIRTTLHSAFSPHGR